MSEGHCTKRGYVIIPEPNKVSVPLRGGVTVKKEAADTLLFLALKKKAKISSDLISPCIRGETQSVCSPPFRHVDIYIANLISPPPPFCSCFFFSNVNISHRRPLRAAPEILL